MLKKKVSTQPNQEVSQTVGYPNVDERFKKKGLSAYTCCLGSLAWRRKKENPQV